MNSYETNVQEMPHFADDVPEKYRKVLEGEPSNNYNFRQWQLAVERYSKMHPEETITHKKLDEIVLDWADSDLSKVFHSIANDPNFKDHYRFKGNISNITLDDIEHYEEHEAIPRH